MPSGAPCEVRRRAPSGALCEVRRGVCSGASCEVRRGVCIGAPCGMGSAEWYSVEQRKGAEWELPAPGPAAGVVSHSGAGESDVAARHHLKTVFKYNSSSIFVRTPPCQCIVDDAGPIV